MRIINPGAGGRIFIHGVMYFFALLSVFTQAAPSTNDTLAAMKKASRFMVEKVSYQGGYVWSYLPDFSRQWGELEAPRTMIWMQPPGTATVGHLLLDAYHATGDEYYYQAAEKTAGAIIWAQHPGGGWNYVADFAGETSLRDWYNTIGKNAWRLEEFQVYYGNATFDDGGTAEAAKFLLRMYMEKRDPKYRPALDKAIDFVLNSQYPIGGWPQRFPLRESHPYKDHPDYSSFITFNDDVADENIDFLLMCNQALGEVRVIDPVIRAMNSFIVMQLGQPQPGWALQYSLDLQPAAARSYEPKSLAINTTADNIAQLIKFYRLTGETKFLARIPEALNWLEKARLPTSSVQAEPLFAGNIEVGTGNILYTHRRGSNVVNGEYFVDQHAEKTLAHYGSTRHVNLPALRASYAEALALSPEQLMRNSVFKNPQQFPLPVFYTLTNGKFSDLNLRGKITNTQNVTEADAQKLITTLNKQGYWPTPLYYTSHPYHGEPPASAASNDDRYAQTMVGDEWDTSPYPIENPVLGISTGVYIKNMVKLIVYLNQKNNISVKNKSD